MATALPTIGRAFDDFENLSWVVIAYLLTSTVVAPLYGKLSDIYGRRGMMLVALGVFMAGSAASAAAPSMLMLILGRGVQGIGGGGIVPLAQSIIADAVPPRERGYYQAYTGSVWIIAGAGGPVLGGVIAEHFALVDDFLAQCSALPCAAALLSHRQLKRLPRQSAPTYDRCGRRRADDGVRHGIAARADLGRNALSMAVAADRHADCRGTVLLAAMFIWWVLRVPEPFLPIAVLNNPVMRVGTLCDRLHAGRLHRAHHLRAALLRAGARAVGERFRPGADSDRYDDDAGLVPVRPRHAAH